jgi:DNA topoisomerase VI subunit A
MWLGLHPSDLETVAPESLMPLTPRDVVIANNLARRTDVSAAVARAAQAMLSRGDKAELESLYTTATGLKAVGMYVFRTLRDKRAIV